MTHRTNGFTVLVKGAGKTFFDNGKDSVILENLNFGVTAGEILAICGLSGVGKSTLLRLISGLTAATSGEIEIDGKSVVTPPEKIGFVTQDYSKSLFPWLNVARNVGMPFKSLKSEPLSKADQKVRIAEVLTEVGLTQAANLFPWQLSGGMQQRVAIARALIARPRLLLLDEPFASVDAHVRLELEDLVAKLVEEYGVTTILVTHDVDEAIYMADRVIILSGAPARIGMEMQVGLSRPRNQVTTRADTKFAEKRNQLYLGLRK